MKTRNFSRSAVFAALAAATLITATAQSASAQQVVAASCPEGYALSGNRCIRTGPTPSCPSGYVFSAGSCVTTTQVSGPVTKTSSSDQWTFITREAFGVRSAKEVDGANFCAVTGSPSVNDAQEFFKENGLNATHVKVDNNRDGIKTYQKYDCDLLVVANRVADSTAESLNPKGAHVVLPEKFGSVGKATSPVAAKTETPVPLPPKPPVAAKPQPKPTKTATTQQSRPKPKPRVRCSAVRYGYTRGNTCGCAGGRVFNGRACVKPRRRW